MPYGIQIHDENGSLAFEAGPHVVQGIPGFADKMGQVAAAWAMAEGLLGCYYGVLLESTVDEAMTKLGKRNAADITKEARKIAKDMLAGTELETIISVLGGLDAAREPRNRVQHDIWGRRIGDTKTLYAVRAEDYRKLVLDVVESIAAGPEGAKRAMEAARKYAQRADNAFTVESLEKLRGDIERTSEELFGALISRIRACG